MNNKQFVVINISASATGSKHKQNSRHSGRLCFIFIMRNTSFISVPKLAACHTIGFF